MNSSRLKVLLGTALLSLAMSGAVYAGGFARGTADTDILYEEGNFNMRSSVTYVSPTRKYSSNIGNPGLVGVDYAESFAIPSAAIKLKIFDNLSCAGTLTQSYGAGAKWPTPSGTLGKLSESFTMYEYAATCGVKMNLDKGRIWFIGGVYNEMTDYNLSAAGGSLSVDLHDSNIGWRAGLAYEIPEIALRAQLMYRSGVDISATGSANGLLPAYGYAHFPKSLEFKGQTGVAPDWLVYGSVKWTDWSATERLDLEIPAYPPSGLKSGNLYYWKDGWTITTGVGHKFNDWLSGTIFVGYDSGVSTGYDLTAESYTVGGGVAMKDNWGGELRLGGAVSHLGSVSESKYSAGDCPSKPTCGWNRTVESGWAYALNAGYAVKW